MASDTCQFGVGFSGSSVAFRGVSAMLFEKWGVGGVGD